MIKSITRKDIAKEAGVSVSVVSRALNNSGYVEKGKKERIIEIANRLGYIPNPVAMALQQKKTKQLLFFCGDLTGSYFNQMYHGMAREAEKRGYYVLAVMNNVNFELVKRILADGVLFPSEGVAQAYAEHIGKNYHIPSVTASFNLSAVYAKPMPTVVIDNYKVVNKMIDYLMSRGHKKIGMALPFNSGYANARFQCWKDRMVEQMGQSCMKYILDIKGVCKSPIDLPYDDLAEYRCVSQDFEYFDLVEAGYKAAAYYKQSRHKATAVICFNDDMAIGMIEGLKRCNIKVPEDVSIMGIDGIYTRNHFNPLLTTMGLFPEMQGAKCVDVLIDMLEGKKYKYVNYSPYKILEGETVRSIVY